jgi:hypothetical protein
VLEREVVGRGRFQGDNLKVTDGVGKQIAKLLRENIAAPPVRRGGMIFRIATPSILSRGRECAVFYK